MKQRNILLATIGSAGDVHPVIALGIGLAARGQRPIVVANAHFRPLVVQHGLDFIPLGSEADYRAITEDSDLWHPRKGFTTIMKYGAEPSVRPLYEIIAQFDPADTVVASAGFLFGARIAHEKLGTPWVTVHLQPSVFRSAHDPSALGGVSFPAWLPPWFMRAYYRVLDAALIDRTIAPYVNPVRQELGLPSQTRFLGDDFHAPQKSVGLFPAWYAPPPPDWPAQTVLTGFVRYDRSGDGLDPAVAAFLDAGEPPIVFTAGSAMRHGADFFATSLGAAQRLQRRAILLTQYPEQAPADLPQGIITCRYVPFSQVLPRAAALVHHGGIGTVAQALAAGIPQLVTPFSHDQPDNARRLQHLGVADSLPPQKYSAAAAAAKLDQLLCATAVQARCWELAQRIDFDRALAEACAAIESV